jgi:hypothetical protein
MRIILLLILPLFCFSQSQKNSLLPHEDILIVNDRIYYVIREDAPHIVPPLELNPAYLVIYDHGRQPQQATFQTYGDLETYLINADFAGKPEVDEELFLKSLALHYISLIDKKTAPISGLDHKLEKLIKSTNSHIRLKAGLVNALILQIKNE